MGRTVCSSKPGPLFHIALNRRPICFSGVAKVRAIFRTVATPFEFTQRRMARISSFDSRASNILDPRDSKSDEVEYSRQGTPRSSRIQATAVRYAPTDADQWRWSCPPPITAAWTVWRWHTAAGIEVNGRTNGQLPKSPTFGTSTGNINRETQTCAGSRIGRRSKRPNGLQPGARRGGTEWTPVAPLQPQGSRLLQSTN